MKLKFKHDFLDKCDLKELTIWKSVGEHSQLYALFHYVESDFVDNLGEILGQSIICHFDDDDIHADIFKGIITAINVVVSETEAKPRMVKVTAYSESIKADLVPRARVFQDPEATLGDIVDEVFSSFVLQAERSQGDFHHIIPLSIQYNETDFQYLKRILTAYCIPIVVDDLEDVVYTGNPCTAAHSLEDNDINGDSYVGRFTPLLSGESYGIDEGKLGELQDAIAKFSESLGESPQYFTSSIHQTHKMKQESTLSAMDMAEFFAHTCQHKIRTKRIFMQVGDKVEIENNGSGIVLDCMFKFIAGDDRAEYFEQKYILTSTQSLYPLTESLIPDELQNTHSPSDGQNIMGLSTHLSRNKFQPMNGMIPSSFPLTVPWQSQIFIAEVTKNEGDPENLGRVQVCFDWEDGIIDEEKQCWIDVLTPFAGQTDNTYGFLMLPEVGEKVLVRFIEPWDDKPVLIGSLRREQIDELLDTAKHKCIRTPGGNCIDLVSDEGKETLRLRAGKSDQFHLLIETSADDTQITLQCNDNVRVKAKSIMIEGKDVNIKGDNVGIKSKKSLDVEAGADLSLKSTSGTKMNSKSVISINGSLIKLN